MPREYATAHALANAVSCSRVSEVRHTDIPSLRNHYPQPEKHEEDREADPSVCDERH